MQAEIARASSTRSSVFAEYRAPLVCLRSILVRLSFGSAGPALEGREDVTEERPDEWEIGDEYRDRRFPKIPVHVNVADERRDETVNFRESGSDNNEATHAEQKQQDQLLLERQADSHQHRNGDEQHKHVG